MESRTNFQIRNSYSSEETFALGKQLGESAKAGEVYCLFGDLGTGKTVFSQGFAAGLGVEGPVNSPTFTIVQEYPNGRLPFYHFDVYRIEEAEEMEEIGYPDYFYGSGVCLVEWAGRIQELLPDNRVEIYLDKDLSQGTEYRKISILSCP